MAVALNENVAKGLDNVVEFSTVWLPVSMACDICWTFSNGVAPTASRGNNSEKAVYLIN